jgi:hypothetical protein
MHTQRPVPRSVATDAADGKQAAAGVQCDVIACVVVCALSNPHQPPPPPASTASSTDSDGDAATAAPTKLTPQQNRERLLKIKQAS